MKALERRGFFVLHIVVAVTGFAYLYMKYFVTSDDPFAVVNHPLEPFALSAHIVAAPVFVLFFGMILRTHTLPKLRGASRTNRRTGWVSLASFAAMSVSGYLLQTTVTPWLVRTWFWTHIVAALIFVTGYGIHFGIGWRIGRQARRRERARR